MIYLAGLFDSPPKQNLQYPRFSQVMTVSIKGFWLRVHLRNSEVKKELSTHLYDAKHNYSGTGSVTLVDDIDLNSQQFSTADCWLSIIDVSICFVVFVCWLQDG